MALDCLCIFWDWEEFSKQTPVNWMHSLIIITLRAPNPQAPSAYAFFICTYCQNSTHTTQTHTDTHTHIRTHAHTHTRACTQARAHTHTHTQLRIRANRAEEKVLKKRKVYLLCILRFRMFSFSTPGGRPGMFGNFQRCARDPTTQTRGIFLRYRYFFWRWWIITDPSPWGEVHSTNKIVWTVSSGSWACLLPVYDYKWVQTASACDYNTDKWRLCKAGSFSYYGESPRIPPLEGTLPHRRGNSKQEREREAGQ